MVERYLAKVNVVGSNPISRSKFETCLIEGKLVIVKDKCCSFAKATGQYLWLLPWLTGKMSHIWRINSEVECFHDTEEAIGSSPIFSTRCRLLISSVIITFPLRALNPIREIAGWFFTKKIVSSGKENNGSEAIHYHFVTRACLSYPAL